MRYLISVLIGMSCVVGSAQAQDFPENQFFDAAWTFLGSVKLGGEPLLGPGETAIDRVRSFSRVEGQREDVDSRLRKIANALELRLVAPDSVQTCAPRGQRSRCELHAVGNLIRFRIPEGAGDYATMWVDITSGSIGRVGLKLALNRERDEWRVSKVLLMERT